MANLCCPRCSCLLVRRLYKGLPLERCPGCGGAWAEELAVRQLAEGGDVSFTAEEERLLQGTGKLTAAPGAAIPCPACRREMEHFRFREMSLDLDQCRGHGTWFDVGEIQQFQRWRRPESSAASPLPTKTTPWTCPSCGESLEAQFQTCWNCLTERATGKPDPDAQREDYNADAVLSTEEARNRVRFWLKELLPALVYLALRSLPVGRKIREGLPGLKDLGL